MEQYGHGVSAPGWERKEIYWPEKRPGFAAWVTGFDYGDGRVGISFKETKKQTNKSYIPPKLEMGEAVGAPVSYCSVECGSPTEESFRVYMISEDGGKTFRETGRCPLEEGSFCNVGFPDGRIIGMDVPRINEERTGWCDYIDVRESLDGGATWRRVNRLLEGCAPYLWRTRRLKDGTIMMLASLYGTVWGKGRERTTRNTMLPGETYLHKIQTFFMTSRDGVHFDGPHYILPGVGAHEYDFVELADGSLLFIAGDIQATPVARQIVKKQGNGYINGTLYGIRRGAPQDPQRNPQGGFVPESMVILPDGLIVGSRRNRPYSCSNDLGENWFEIDGLPASLYQPYMLLLPDGTIANFGHKGGDSAFGQEDMYIGADFFTVDNTLPKAGKLSLIRELTADGSHYENRFSARFTVGDVPVPGQPLTFRFTPVWNTDGSVNAAPQESAPIQLTALTDETGTASAMVPQFDHIGDIHFYYNVDVAYLPSGSTAYQPCAGPLMCVAALTPFRQNLHPHDAYLNEGTLYLSPALLKQFPELLGQLSSLCGGERLPDNAGISDEAIRRLTHADVLIPRDGGLYWLPSVHAPRPLDRVLPMSEGDWYI